MQRKEVTFVCGTDTCAAWLYPPAGGGADGTVALIVMAHGLTGTRRDRLGPFAQRFADARIAALVFAHPGFGDSTGEPDHVDPALQLEDWRAAIAFARSLPGVDPGRIATFGSSLGGGNAPATAAEDAAIAPPRSARCRSSTATVRRTARRRPCRRRSRRPPRPA